VNNLSVSQTRVSNEIGVGILFYFSSSVDELLVNDMGMHFVGREFKLMLNKKFVQKSR